ncbi:hypothetical protein ABB37_03314 [Leptomonas pyrrhocoris]|uniref:Uncharacterized protein n=1 Tax=Leptomonas pyrrhocoris TaxID=157538 RepID=A0A0N0DWU8_LEPPY|nr:hypothetical protein ABB37_03314 [Leptomonas pyrrhocoris]KPA82192.1 hypothetical protein ABB37_03314 [Leptomonas pyrrhocoris]|eukprot:XP_015660631.1 hypothetical protein ABB37_03314 [Leptomonas pyrrhocoris]
MRRAKMNAQEVSNFIDELAVFLDSQAGPGSDGAVDSELLNALADYIEGVDPIESSLEELKRSLESASHHEHATLDERSRMAGSCRSLKLLREAFRRV